VKFNIYIKKKTLSTS